MWTLKHYFRITYSYPDLVLLDLPGDRYSIIPDVDLTGLNSALAGTENSEVVDYLASIGAISRGTPTLQLEPNSSRGMFEERFMTPLAAGQAPSPRTRFASYMELVRSSLWIRKHNLGNVLEALAGSATKPKGPKISIDALKRALSDAFILDLSGNRCLTYSYALTRLARQHSIAARLVIGVRTRPFYSHAWVEVDGTVVNDDPGLRNKLAIIAEA